MSETQEAVQDGAHETPSTEDRARDMGWRPKEEFRGDDTKWVDAETFVKRGEEYLPFIKAQSKKDREALAKAEGEISEMKRTFAEFKKHHSQTEQRAYQRAMKDLEQRQVEAVEAGDIKAVKAITKEMTDLSKDVQTDGRGNPYETPEHAKTLNQWRGENGWYGSDVAMTAAAEAIAADLERSGVLGAEQLAEVTKRIKAEFPHKFQNAARNGPAAVEGAAPPRKGGKTWSDLPADVRATADRWVKQGLLTREQYLKDYQW